MSALELRKTFPRSSRVMIALFGLLLATGGCNRGAAADGDQADGDEDTVLLEDALGFDGTATGKVADHQSTRTSLESTASAQELPPAFDAANTRVSFKDLSGRDLAGPDGQPLPEVSVSSDGAFRAEGLPVGADFAICVDFDQDGVCEIESTISIPSTEGGAEGEITDVQVDPLTTLILAKLRALAESRGVEIDALQISPHAVMARIVSAYENLFADAGIEQEITLEDVAALTEEQLAELFDAVVPSLAKAGMAIVEGNLAASRASDAEALAIAAAAVFVQAGFPVADMPGPPDLSSLAALEGVRVTTREELLGELLPRPDSDAFPEELPEDLLNQFPDGVSQEDLLALFPDGVPEDFQLQPAQADEPAPLEEKIYISSTTEPDRNFGSADDDAVQEGRPPLPILHDFVLVQMAELQLAGQTLTLGELYEVMTSLDSGLGIRLVYFVFDPNFGGPPLSVFQTADKQGLAINFDRLLGQFLAGGFSEASPEDLQARDAELRQLMRDLLGGTVPPPFEGLYEGVVMGRVPSAAELAARIREAQAHLPFSRSGPSAFFVVADGDPFRGDADASAVTVNAQVDADGNVSSVEHVADGDGTYYLGFTERTENEGIVQLIVRETGRFLQSVNGRPVRVSLFDELVFPAVGGVPFADLVSESGVFYPGVNVAVVNTEFVPQAPPPDAVSPAQLESSAPNAQLFVLATGIGAGAAPVRVDYDFTTSTATYNPNGRNLLMFLPDSHQTGQFALFNEATGRPASLNDPLDFFGPPPPPPEGFEDFFNEGSDATDTQPVVDDGSGGSTMDDGTTVESEEPITPAQLVDEGSVVVNVDTSGFILVAAESVVGLPLSRDSFTHVFGIDAPNERYDAGGDPYFDDLDGDGLQDENEPTAPHRPTLFDPADWRSTDVRLYYRRADNGAGVTFEQIQFDSPTPVTIDGVPLVPRNFVPRLNAFRFGRPNTALNLLTAFAPPEFFDGAHTLDRDTAIDVFSAVAMINLVMDQVFNVQADVDIDGMGPLPRQSMLADAHMFVAPIGDPFVLILNAFRTLATGRQTQ